MTWQFGPTRFTHVSCHIGESARPVVRARPWIPGMSGGLAGAPPLTMEREERLLIALNPTLSDCEGRCGEWPPSCIHRGQMPGAFVRGDLGLSREAAERFMDCLIETVTLAFLEFEFEPCRWSSATVDSVIAPCAQ